MTDETKRPVGLTKDVGFQIGVRRTLPMQLDAAWHLLTYPVTSIGEQSYECW